MSPGPRVAARILATDLACLGHEVAASVRSGADLLHVDVMDLDSVHVSVGPRACAALRRVTRAPLEVHLMTRPAADVVAAYAAAGGDVITFHLEASDDVRGTVRGVRARGCKVGVAVSADEPLSALDPLLDDIDEVLITWPGPGAGGDRVDRAALRKIHALRERILAAGAEVAISVEGGIDADNAFELVDAGADTLVVGAAVCRSGDRATTIAALKGIQGPCRADALRAPPRAARAP